MTQLGGFNDNETLYIENKSFHLYPRSMEDVSDVDIFNMVKTGKCPNYFKDIMHDELIKYIADTIPKYMSCYSNANINGILRFGVDDNAENVGCPCFTSLSELSINNAIRESIEKNVRSGKSSKDLLDCIEVRIIPLDVTLSVLSDDATPLYNTAIDDILRYNDLMESFLEQHALFLIQHRKYTQQLEKMLNITQYRIELVDYIKEHSGDKYQYLIDMLNVKDYIILPLDNVESDKQNPSKIFYWIVHFRTMRKKQISLTKPVRPSFPSIYHPRQILSNLPLMRYSFIKSNPDIKYYIIEICLNCANVINKESDDSLFKKDQCYYLPKYGDKWISRTRINYHNIDGPGCTK